MSESQIEMLVERKIDQLDLAYLSGKLSDEEYQSKIEEIYEWADSHYSR